MMFCVRWVDMLKDLVQSQLLTSSRSRRPDLMYEFHGWCSLSMSPSDQLEGVGLDQAVQSIEAFISKLNWANGFCSLRPFNGEYFVHFGGFQNRPRREATDLALLFELVACEAPGSYGLLNWRDDEDLTPPGPGKWRIRVLVRGCIEERFDPLLSPSVPVTEDPISG